MNPLQQTSNSGAATANADSAPSNPETATPDFFRLPAELRINLHKLHFQGLELNEFHPKLIGWRRQQGLYVPTASLLRVCSKIHKEAHPIYRARRLRPFRSLERATEFLKKARRERFDVESVEITHGASEKHDDIQTWKSLASLTEVHIDFLVVFPPMEEQQVNRTEHWRTCLAFMTEWAADTEGLDKNITVGTIEYQPYRRHDMVVLQDQHFSSCKGKTFSEFIWDLPQKQRNNAQPEAGV